MSLMSSLYAGASGLSANSQDLSVIGDNIANANTIGFKASRAAFEDALAQSVINGGQIGMGTRLQAVQRLLAQGSLANTGIATDLALEGQGLFIVNGPYNGQTANYYTRAGQFTVDRDGYLVNLQGLKVQGYPADSTGALQMQIGDLLIGDASSMPRATTELTIRANLDSDAVTPTTPWDPTSASSMTDTSNFSIPTTVYDSLGNNHAVTIYFRKNGTGDWEWHAMEDGAGQSGGTAGTPMEVANGTLAFDTNGALTGSTQTSNFNPVNATNPQALAFDFGTSIADGGTGLDGITQFANTSAASFLGQDGYSAGDLSSIAFDDKGNIVGSFSNGQTRVLGQVAVADFSAADKLQRIGGNLFLQSATSGEPTIGVAGEGGRGAVVAGALEQSNVDMAAEFVHMIAAQRGFQANSKTISTADQLLAELMSLKR
ncbi:MAG: flagellar hook protein FlgE [Deltaproteobacteria bacterium]|nr:flagellar hook protein FlgE [Deltaproteobacteria bacterium]